MVRSSDCPLPFAPRPSDRLTAPCRQPPVPLTACPWSDSSKQKRGGPRGRVNLAWNSVSTPMVFDVVVAGGGWVCGGGQSVLPTRWPAERSVFLDQRTVTNPTTGIHGRALIRGQVIGLGRWAGDILRRANLVGKRIRCGMAGVGGIVVIQVYSKNNCQKITAATFGHRPPPAAIIITGTRGLPLTALGTQPPSNP